MTYIQIINAVLRRLREDQVSAPSDTEYSTLIGDFVNEAKREVEDAHKWHSLRTQITVTTASGTSQYALTGAGNRFKMVDPKRWAYDATNKNYVVPKSSKKVKEMLLEDPSYGRPYAYYIEGKDASGDPYVNFYSTPNGIYSINFEVVVPQADLSSASTVLTVPEYPVILSAYAKALMERGEDNGTTHGGAVNTATVALSDAIALDAAWAEEEFTWSID